MAEFWGSKGLPGSERASSGHFGLGTSAALDSRPFCLLLEGQATGGSRHLDQREGPGPSCPELGKCQPPLL